MCVWPEKFQTPKFVRRQYKQCLLLLTVFNEAMHGGGVDNSIEKLVRKHKQQST